ncbi:MAG: hypothetical protein GC179_01975 [Anaerolineaceae bacterium]|nr:hypothetical protein [Anaerolineaceae bacterium]
MAQTAPSERGERRVEPYPLTLRLNDMQDLFALPRHNAFQEDYLPVSGIDQIAHQLKLARLRHDGSLHVTFILPENSKQDDELSAAVQAAIKRYCETRLANLAIDLKSRQISVIRGLQVGVLILGISLALAAAVSRAEGMVDWLRNLLSNSISIFGTVALWSPADAFLFGMRPLYTELRIYQIICDMSFDIQYEQAGQALAAKLNIGRKERR